jgi:hypothetical protein
MVGMSLFLALEARPAVRQIHGHDEALLVGFSRASRERTEKGDTFPSIYDPKRLKSTLK